MKQTLLLGLMLFAPSAATAQIDTKNSAGAEETIVVTAQRLSDTERALTDCLKRQCPPDQDIDTSLAHAENLFVAGHYQEARATTKASLARNRRHAAAYPVPVSDLERSNGRLSAHLGERFDYQYSTWGIRRALKEGLPENDPRLIGANLEIAQMLVATKRPRLAEQKLREVISDARKIDRPDLAAIARLRIALLEFFNEDEPGGRQAIEKIAASTDPRTAGARLSAKVILAQVDRQKGKPDRTDAILAELRNLKLKQPVLIFSPAYKLFVNETAKDTGTRNDPRTTLRSMAMDTFERKWIDVGFWVRPEGRVEEVEVLRSSGDTQWAEPLVKAVKGRIYTPVAENDAQGAYRVERYSYTSFWEAQTGTRIRQRGPRGRVEYLDLTAPPKVAAAQ